MIHLLEVHPELSLKELKKLSRRYAMTGGYELVLRPGLNKKDLNTLLTLYRPELKSYQSATSKFKSSNAFRILLLVKKHPCADTELIDIIDSLLSPDTRHQTL
jgi:hypothetical protein